DMTFEVCKLEGEDESLESWQKGHEKFFRAEGKSLGYTFTEELPIVFEEFVCVYPNIDGVEKGA
ncbi:MAG: ASCH domain-containing protein, partial [Candidatus Moranbacteria bacterium]|nr:ASCH domain-containing protein [Candidatus Moranbacteria bacterium]